MSNIYIQEPPALGKVLLKTNAGDIDIELWTKEAPKACRNFIQLCLEGYYNGTIFHRVVPDFIVQGGDPNSDGTGGESIYGQPFKDELHSRLRFNRRGLVAMANAGRDDNGSQFFFTLGPTPELQNKHTIFGKVTGETIFTVLKLAEGEIGPDDRPVYPRKITSTEVVINPFTDIVPRIREAKVEHKKERKKEKGVKNLGLLSFGMEAEEDEEEMTMYRGTKSSHDVLSDPKLSNRTAAELGLEDDAELKPSNKSETETQQAATNIRDKLKRKKDSQFDSDKKERGKSNIDKKDTGKSDIDKKGGGKSDIDKKDRDQSDIDKKDKAGGSKKEDEEEDLEEEYYLGKDRDIERRKERDRIREEINQLKKDMKRPKLQQKVEPETSKSSTEQENELKRQYEEEQEKYRKLKEKIPKKGAARQDYTLALLQKFKSKLSAMKEKAEEGGAEERGAEEKTDDDDVSGDDWMAHKLQFEDKGPVLAKDASTKGDDWFDIYDPRSAINKRKREESERKQKAVKK